MDSESLPQSTSESLNTNRNVEYVIFDMDGLMIDSEKIYTEVTNEILAEYGKEMTWDIKAGCMGKPDHEAAIHLLSFFPDISLSPDAYLQQRNALQDTRWPSVPLLPGVRKLVQHLHVHKIPIAVATSSYRGKFELKTAHLGDVFGCFEGNVVCADDKLKDGEGRIRGKPEPDIFLVAARKALGRNVGDGELCTDEQREARAKGIVFEDALPGVQAGKRAGMSVVWVPDANLLGIEYSGKERADQTLRSLEHFVPEQWGLPPYKS